MSKLALTLVLALGLHLGLGSVEAAPPPASTLTAATGAEGLTFTWNVSAGATWYYLWVNDDDAAPKFTKWYTAEEAGCVGTQAVCAVTVALDWRPGAGRWWIRTSNADGNGPWSAAQDFTIPQRRPFRVMDSSVPAKEVGVLLDKNMVMRVINGTPMGIFVSGAGFWFQNVEFYYTTADCGGTRYVIGPWLPAVLLLLGPTVNTNAFVLNTDYAARDMHSKKSYLNGVGQPCTMPYDVPGQTSVSATSISVGSILSPFTPPFVVLP
jgi:hypothetical protein